MVMISSSSVTSLGILAVPLIILAQALYWSSSRTISFRVIINYILYIYTHTHPHTNTFYISSLLIVIIVSMNTENNVSG